jgi:hypothetical protein
MKPTPARSRLALLAAALLLSGSALADANLAARRQYILHCTGCHQADGSGVPSGGVPDMRSQLGHFLKVPEGRAFLVKVPGTSNAALSNSDIARLLNWMLRSFSASDPAGRLCPVHRKRGDRPARRTAGRRGGRAGDGGEPAGGAGHRHPLATDSILRQGVTS